MIYYESGLLVMACDNCGDTDEVLIYEYLEFDEEPANVDDAYSMAQDYSEYNGWYITPSVTVCCNCRDDIGNI